MIALIGHLSRDVFPDRPPAVGGGSYHGARALSHLGTPARVVARCALADRAALLRPVVRLGSPVSYVPAVTTASCFLDNRGDERTMRLEAIGDVWEPGDVPDLPTSVAWLHIAPLARSDFPTRVLAFLATRFRISYDAQGLVRVPEVGPLRLDAEFDRDLLRYISILKVAEVEAEVLGDLGALGVPEVVLTKGSRGSTVITADGAVEVPADPLPADPTGAGDVFATTYVVGRDEGLSPVVAARRGTAVVAALMTE